MSIVEIFRAGGPVMWPLLVGSLLTVAVIIERWINLRSSRILNPTVVERITGLVEGGRTDRAIQVCRERPGIYTNIVLAGLEVAYKGEAMAKEAVTDAGRHEAAKLGRYLGVLATVAGVAPLLGLLGTVTGMIEVFQTIAEVGAGQAAQLSSGISQALISTATGLLVAIPSLVAHNIFQAKVDGLITDLERESLRALRGLFDRPHGEGAVAVPSGVGAPADLATQPE